MMRFEQIGAHVGATTPVSDEVLNLVALLPTAEIERVVSDSFVTALTDAHFMRIAVLLAYKSYREGGCPIGAVIVDEPTRRIVGKGHNTLVQENHPYNHGETSAIRDAGRRNFAAATLYTTLSPCDVCAALIHRRGFARVVIGDVTNAAGNEAFLERVGIHVDVCEDRDAVRLYAQYRKEHPQLDREDWGGLAAVKALDR